MINKHILQDVMHDGSSHRVWASGVSEKKKTIKQEKYKCLTESSGTGLVEKLNFHIERGWIISPIQPHFDVGWHYIMIERVESNETTIS